MLSLFSVVAIIFQGRVVALRRRNQHLEAMVEARSREVQVKALELERANEALRDQSVTDPLTGAYNRRYLGQRMPEDVARVRRAYENVNLGKKAALGEIPDLQFLMVDLDYFKTVNDVHGHAAGDRVLQDIAAVLKQCLRETDTLTRWGGEEFLIVARNANRAMASQVAERIRSAVEAHDFLLENGTVLKRTVSLGFAFYPFLPGRPDLFDWQKIIDLADLSMYAAKRGGRNAWVGLLAAPEADPERLEAGLPTCIEELVGEGHLKALAALQPGGELRWDEPRP